MIVAAVAPFSLLINIGILCLVVYLIIKLINRRK